MNLDFEQTYTDVSDTQTLMKMTPDNRGCKIHTAVIQKNLPIHMFDQLCFKAEVDIVRKWVVELGFNLATHMYDFQTKKIIEIPNVDLNTKDVVINIPAKGLVTYESVLEPKLVNNSSVQVEQKWHTSTAKKGVFKI